MVYELINKAIAATDDVVAMVIRAESEIAARTLAASAAGDEGAAVWHDPKTSDCTLIDPDGPPEVLAREVRVF